LPDSICVAEYAPYSALFARARLVVHQGGVGTTAQCLRAGKPMLIMPYSHDQPDNARRMRRLGVARVIQKSNYSPKKVTRRLSKMLEETNIPNGAVAATRSLKISQITPKRLAHILRSRKAHWSYADRARAVSEMLHSEDGVKRACDALEALHAKSKAKR
jgi:UDP:flavonoid glycosyltransferase YjiC (YdhE family)